MTSIPAYPDSVSSNDPHAPWNEPDPWEGHECRDCYWFCYMRDDNRTVCIQDAAVNDGIYVDEVKETDAACESFKEN